MSLKLVCSRGSNLATTSNQFYQFVKDKQKDRGWNQRDLAAEVSKHVGHDVSHTTIGRMIRAKNPTPNPGMELFAALADIFGVSREYLLQLRYPTQYAKASSSELTPAATEEFNKLSESDQRGVIDEIKKRK